MRKIFIDVFNKFYKCGAETRMLKIKRSAKIFEIRELCFDSLFNLLVNMMNLNISTVSTFVTDLLIHSAQNFKLFYNMLVY